MKSSISLFVLTLIFCACHTHPSVVSVPTSLTDSSFYNIDTIQAMMGQDHVQAGEKKLLQATDIYINAKDPAKSIPLFKEAIHLQPSAKAYFELGSALLDDSRYEEAVLSLHVAEKLGYSPLANVMFKLSEAHAYLLKPQADDAAKQDSLALHYMELALQMGYVHPEEFAKGNAFLDLRNFYVSFNDIYNNALAGGAGSGNPENILWSTFQAGFHPIDLPLTINAVWIKEHKPDEPIGYDFEKFVPEMRNAKFSREVEKEYYYFALLKKDTAYTALLYAGVNNFLTDSAQNSPVFYLLTTYDHNGKIIDKMQVAGQATFTDVFKVLTLQPNFDLVIQDFKNIYKDDPEKAGYDSNSVVRTESQGTSTYRIAANGKFEKKDAPLAMR